MSQENVEIVSRCIELFNRRDLAQTRELVHPDIEIDLSRNIFNPGIYHGHAGIERWRDAIDEVWEDFHGAADELLDAGDRIIVGVKLGGRGRESGVEVTMKVFSIWTVRDSKVLQVVGGYRERSEVLEAVGLSG